VDAELNLSKNINGKTMIKKIGELLPQEQKWLAKAVVSIILADGIVEEKQISFLKKLFRSFLSEEPKETLNEISTMLKQKKTPQLDKISVDKLDNLIFILDVLTASVFANGKKLRQETEKYFEAGRKLGLEVGTLSYRLSLEAEKERVKRKLSVVKEEIGEFFHLS
jgi:hypothetical protein